ncbi:ac transposable element-derived protein [Colletotrichum incanum]|uniref:Ac transposable element-derived protein n=1 Tax=Colletotrichum incanum TaxID=1573173 RepID=A0A167D3C5_COLIC|nr:ac transposable element-derived protein [Colletotrichum incanum]
MPDTYQKVNGWSAYIQDTGDSFYTAGSDLTSNLQVGPLRQQQSRLSRSRPASRYGFLPNQATVSVTLLPAAIYHVFLDNLFSSVRLFRALQKQQVRASGTCRKDGGIDKILIAEKATKGRDIP